MSDPSPTPRPDGGEYDRLIARRDELILAGVDPNELLVPIKPLPGSDAVVSASLIGADKPDNPQHSRDRDHSVTPRPDGETRPQWCGYEVIKGEDLRCVLILGHFGAHRDRHGDWHSVPRPGADELARLRSFVDKADDRWDLLFAAEVLLKERNVARAEVASLTEDLAAAREDADIAKTMLLKAAGERDNWRDIADSLRKELIHTQDALLTAENLGAAYRRVVEAARAVAVELRSDEKHGAWADRLNVALDQLAAAVDALPAQHPDGDEETG